MDVIILSDGDARKITYLHSMRETMPMHRDYITMISVDDNVIIWRNGWKTVVFFSIEVSTAGKSYTVLVSCRLDVELQHSHLQCKGAGHLIKSCETEIVNRLVYLSDYCRSLTEFCITGIGKNIHNKIKEFQDYCESPPRKNISLERDRAS